jgi:hypothetical protein
VGHLEQIFLFMATECKVSTGYTLFMPVTELNRTFSSWLILALKFFVGVGQCASSVGHLEPFERGSQ